MSITPSQRAKIAKKDAEMPASLKRDALTNYREGWFFVTLNTRDETPILSSITGTTDGTDTPHCVYTELGKRIKETWQSIPTYHPFAVIDECEVMPEHFHGLIYLKPGNKRHLGSLISSFMGECTHAYWDQLGIDWHTNRYDRGASALKIDRDRDHTHSLRGPSLFVHGYNDVEPLTEQQLQIKREYIRNQAYKRLLKGTFHNRFRIFRNQHSTNWTPEVVQQAICADSHFARNRQQGISAYMKVAERLNGESTLCLDYLGNKQLLAAKQILPLICHRADENLFGQQKAATLQAARKGAVIVSAFISPKEREIREQLLTELLPFIEIVDNGFSDRYKPSGKSFYACAENRLVQITPWQYFYQKNVQISREMCLVMNQLARIISKQNDDWWQTQP